MWYKYCLFFFLLACGISPLYGIKTSNFWDDIYIARIENRDGQILRNRLRQYCRGGHKSLYTLHISIKFSQAVLALEKDATVSRYKEVVSVTVELMHRKKQVYKQVFTEAGQYMMGTHTHYANVVTKQETRKRILDAVAMQIISDLGVYLRSSNKSGSL